MEKFVANNKRSNLLRLYIPVFALLFLDMVSKEYLVALQLEECNIQSLVAQDYYNKRDFVMADTTRDTYLRLLEAVPKAKGVVHHLPSHPCLTYLLNQIALFLGL